MSDQETALLTRIADLEAYVVMLRRHPALMSDVLGITPIHSRIIQMLREAAPERVWARDIERLLCSENATSRNLARVHVGRLRKSIEPFGIIIESTCGLSIPGWGLSLEMVERLDAVLEQRSAGIVGSAA